MDFYDDIGGALKIKKLRVEKEELLESLEMYYRVFFLGEDVDKREDRSVSCVDKLINRENSSSSDVTFEFTKRVIVERIE